MVKAVVVGAAGGIGQPLSLLFKLSPYVTDLALYDVVNTPGVAADLGHISTPAKVAGYLPADDGMQKALTGADIIIVPAGLPRKPGMTRDDLFVKNAAIVRDIAQGIASHAPKAFILIISNPVNSTVPIVAEVLKKNGVFNPAKLFGVTTLDVVRASTFTAELAGGNPEDYTIPVVGGHAGTTILPLISQSRPPVKASQADIEKLTNRIQFGGDEVVKAKDGAGSATLSMAYAGYKFAEVVLKISQKGLIVPSFVYLPGVNGGEALSKTVGDLEYFSGLVELGAEGVVKVHSLGAMSDFEKKALETAVPELKTSIDKGIQFVNSAKL